MSKELLNEFVSAAAPVDGETDEQRKFRLTNMIVGSVHLVNRGANKRVFAVRKSADGALDLTEKADGTLSSQKADVLPAKVKAAMLESLSDAAERLMAVIARVKDATEGEGDVPEDLISAVAEVASEIISSVESDTDKGMRLLKEATKKENPMTMNPEQVTKFETIKKELTVALVGGEDKKEALKDSLRKVQNFLWEMKPDEASFKSAVDGLVSALSGIGGGTVQDSAKAAPETAPAPADDKKPTDPPMEPTAMEKAFNAFASKMEATVAKLCDGIEKACGKEKKGEPESPAPGTPTDEEMSKANKGAAVAKSAPDSIPAGNGSTAPESGTPQHVAKGAAGGNSPAWISGLDLNAEPFGD